MKVVGTFATLALALASFTAQAQSTSGSSDDTQVVALPEPGGVSQAGVLSIFSAGALPTGAIVVGGLVIVGGVVVGVVAATDDSTVTTSTN